MLDVLAGIATVAVAVHQLFVASTARFRIDLSRRADDPASASLDLRGRTGGYAARGVALAALPFGPPLLIALAIGLAACGCIRYSPRDTCA